MHITDPIADMLTRIRNANSAKHETVDIPASNMKKAIAQILLGGAVRMSRIGLKPIVIPAGVEVSVNGENTVTVKGPNGTLTQDVSKDITVTVDGSEVKVSRPSDDKEHRALHGLYRALIANMVKGVTEGFKKNLEVNGVGYRVQMQGNTLVMNLGFSHQVKMDAPEGIKIECPSANAIVISGADKQKVGQFAAQVREKRPPEPYKGKGIKYAEEHIRRKEGKAGKK